MSEGLTDLLQLDLKRADQVSDLTGRVLYSFFCGREYFPVDLFDQLEKFCDVVESASLFDFESGHVS